MKKVVFLGDFNVDIILDNLEAMPIADREVRCGSFDLAIGSSACIAACAYASLGGSAWFCGLAGGDYYGKFLQEGLAGRCVHTDDLRFDQRLRTGVTINLVSGTSRSQVTYPGAMAEFSLVDVGAGVFQELQHLHVSGIFQADAMLPDVEALFSRARSAGATVSLDCQWDQTERWDRLEKWLPFVDWLFANADEACSMTRCRQPAQALEALAARTKCPVVKTGEKGALLWVDGRCIEVPAPRVEVVDTVGAGDNFDAGFLYGTIEEQMPLVEAVRFANAAAALSCTYRGGTGACSSAHVVTLFMKENS
jgi:sugar/nucleoside kinase (ribokinase family)